MFDDRRRQAIVKILLIYLKIFRWFLGSSSKKIDFAHRSGALARPGSRELRAVKIPASYDAWRPPKRRKNDLVKIRFFSVPERTPAEGAGQTVVCKIKL